MEKFRDLSLFTLTAGLSLLFWPVTLAVLGISLLAFLPGAVLGLSKASG